FLFSGGVLDCCFSPAAACSAGVAVEAEPVCSLPVDEPAAAHSAEDSADAELAHSAVAARFRCVAADDSSRTDSAAADSVRDDSCQDEVQDDCSAACCSDGRCGRAVPTG